MFPTALVFSTILVSSVIADCEKCESRKFGSVEPQPQDCICEEAMFCNKITNKCQQCGTCFNYWNKIVGNDKDELLIEIERLDYIYKLHFKELEKLIEILDFNLKKAADSLEKLNTVTKQTDENIVNVRDKVDVLKEDLTKIKKAVNMLKAEPTNVDVIMDEIREFSVKIEDLLKQLLDMNLDLDAELTIIEMKKKLEEMQNDIRGLNELPSINAESSLNLALHIENGLDLLDSKTSLDDIEIDFHKYEEHLQPIHWNMVKLISYILDIMNNSGIVKKYADEVEKLKKDSSNLKNLADSLKSTLARIIKDEKSFYEAYESIKREILDFKSIQDLQDRLRTLEVEIEKSGEVTKELKENSRQLMLELDYLFDKLDKSLEAFKHENETLSKNLKALQAHEPQFDALLEDALIQREALEGMEEYKSVKELEAEIDEMINNINVYATAFEEYCKEAREHEIAALKST